jgi:glycosyltransferase involved in cell wall biosynthesis
MSALTVLMPVHNAERYLEAAMKSILGQTFDDFMFLIVDDGSTDRSAEIIHSHRDPRILYLRNETNLGISATLNRGTELAGTELIARMDADDISYPERLWKQHRYLESNPDCAMVSTLTRNISEEGAPLAVDQLKSEYFYYNLTFYSWIYHPTVMYRRSAVRKVGMYPAGFAEDYRLWCRLVREHKIWNLPEVLLDYRVNTQSTSNVLRKEYCDDEKQQVLENLRFFMGEDYTIPGDWLECYRNNFEPILRKRSIREVVSCLKELDAISAGVMGKENVNRDVAVIQKAAREKKSHILRRCLRGFTLREKIALLVCTGSVKALAALLGRVVQKRAGRLLRPVSACLAHLSGARAARRIL